MIGATRWRNQRQTGLMQRGEKTRVSHCLRFYCMTESTKRSNWELAATALVPLSVIVKAICAVILALCCGH